MIIKGKKNPIAHPERYANNPNEAAQNTAVPQNQNSDTTETPRAEDTVKSTSKSPEKDYVKLISVESVELDTKKQIEKKKQPKLSEHSGKVIAPERQKPPERSVITAEEIETSCDGVKVLPLKIGVYDSVDINREETKICKQIGRKSFTRNPFGELVQCLVVKTTNAFAVPIYDDDADKTYLQWAMNRVDLIKKVKAADGQVYVDLKIEDNMNSKIVRVPYSQLMENGIKSLAKYNISIFPTYPITMSIYLQRLAETIPMTDASQVYGIVSDPATHELAFNCYAGDGLFQTKSQYQNFREYLDAFNPLLKQSEPLQYLLSATMAAPILTILQTKFNADLHSYCINIVGSSSTGKTICSRVCAAAWTNPNDDSIFSAMLSTGNAALKRLSGRFGVPTFLDEATILGGVKTEEYAYSVYEGREKRRLNSDCSEKASGTWSTIVCMSSEQHFHCNTKNQNGGLAVRVHSIENLPWTASKKHAEMLSAFIASNYGVLGREYTKLLFRDSMMEELQERYADAKDTMDSYCADSYNDFTDRLCNTYALTYMTAVILHEMGLAVNVEAVSAIMAEHNAMVASEQNLAANAFRSIVSYVARNSCRTGIRIFTNPNKIMTKVAIEESLFAEILEKSGFQDTKVTVKELDKAGYLIRQVAAGLKSKLTIDGSLCWCYQLDMSSLSDGAVIENTETNAQNITYLTACSDDDDEIEFELDDTAEEADLETDDEYCEESGIDWDEISIYPNHPRQNDIDSDDDDDDDEDDEDETYEAYGYGYEY